MWDEELRVTYAMYGHIDVGCLHVRPALDMTDPEDEQKLRWLTDRVAETVKRHGGVLWGEHGKGFRSEYNPIFFGERHHSGETPGFPDTQVSDSFSQGTRPTHLFVCYLPALF